LISNSSTAWILSVIFSSNYRADISSARQRGDDSGLQILALGRSETAEPIEALITKLPPKDGLIKTTSRFDELKQKY
jgi:hypothetical protein